MIRAFMIEFEYNGKTQFGNVVEYKHSPSVFYVSTVAQERTHVYKFVLRQSGGSILPIETSLDTPDGLLQPMTEKIREYVEANPLPS